MDTIPKDRPTSIYKSPAPAGSRPFVRFTAYFALVLAAFATVVWAASCSSSQGYAQTVEPKKQDAAEIEQDKPMDGLFLYARESEKTVAGAPVSEPVPATGEQIPGQNFNTEEYRGIVDNSFLDSTKNPLSTFSIDVDTASYSNVRRFLNGGSLPPADAVRIEEFVNYFPYDYEAPRGDDPVAVGFAMSAAPWNEKHRLLRVSLKAREISYRNLPPSNLVFLLDTSGSMADENKLPLLKESLKVLVENLRDNDSVSIVAYAGSAGLVLDNTSGSQKDKIVSAFDRLESGGSTAGGEGILLAYEIAKKHFVKNGNNRVILCTDGDFNVGVSSSSELERLIEKKRAENIYLTVLGFGMGNYKDDRMESLADKGNGNYAYIDNLLEGRKVLGKEIWGNLFAVAKDVKIQIEFNPAKVSEYRLIGYENRLLAKEDFNDDTKDAGEMGSGQTVTAFYELVLKGTDAAPLAGTSDDLRFQNTQLVPSNDLMFFKLRYKVPGDGSESSKLISRALDEGSLRAMDRQDDDFRFAASVVEFGMLLRNSPYKANASYASLLERARGALGSDEEAYRSEFVTLATHTRQMAKVSLGQ